jgi:hypothetical protein
MTKLFLQQQQQQNRSQYIHYKTHYISLYKSSQIVGKKKKFEMVHCKNKEKATLRTILRDEV